MPSAERRRRICAVLLAALAALGGCGGGNSSSSTLIVNGTPQGPAGAVVSVDQPQGANTTTITVDSGPTGTFSAGAANLPYVSVKICQPGSASACVTIDHVFLDTGSIGLRVMRSAVAGLALPAIAAGSGSAVECYPFVIGAVWGALARADVTIGGESAASLPLQVIDDRSPAQPAAPADCVAAGSGVLQNSVGSLQANAILGVGMLSYDCGLSCQAGDYTQQHVLYYACNGSGACAATALDSTLQVQNPVSAFAANSDGSLDNNGTLIVLPALPTTGASLATGRLVFGIGTQANNQPDPQATTLHIQTDPNQLDYFYLGATVGSRAYPYSYVDSGSNAFFFADAALQAAPACVGNASGGAWYCPSSPQTRSLLLSDPLGNSAGVSVPIADADVLFATSNVAFANLGGATGSSSGNSFVLGLPFFYGRSVYTSIWGQALASNGPWVAFR